MTIERAIGYLICYHNRILWLVTFTHIFYSFSAYISSLHPYMNLDYLDFNWNKYSFISCNKSSINCTTCYKGRKMFMICVTEPNNFWWCFWCRVYFQASKMSAMEEWKKNGYSGSNMCVIITWDTLFSMLVYIYIVGAKKTNFFYLLIF